MTTTAITPIPGSSITITADAAHSSCRLDLFLSQKIPYYSRTYFKELIEQGLVTLQGKPTKASYLVKEGDFFTITFPELATPHITADQVSHLAVSVIFQHADFLIITKPAGLTVHTPGAGHTEITLVDWLLHYFQEIKAVGSADRPGIVHRLDKDTSGLMIIARNNRSHEVISDMFKNREIHKTYLAVVTGHPEAVGTIDYKVTRHPTNRIKMTHSHSMGREATTHYVVKDYFKDAALVEAKPVTGRTHQIRVHFTAIGHPLLGDALYGSKSAHIARQALHAAALAFTYEGTAYHFTQELPEDMQELIQVLEQKK